MAHMDPTSSLNGRTSIMSMLRTCWILDLPIGASARRRRLVLEVAKRLMSPVDVIRTVLQSHRKKRKIALSPAVNHSLSDSKYQRMHTSECTPI